MVSRATTTALSLVLAFASVTCFAQPPIPADDEQLLREWLVVDDQDTDQDLWARSILLCCPTPREGVVETLFPAALARAEWKAPVLVSLGDAIRPSSFFRDSLQNVVEGLKETLPNSDEESRVQVDVAEVFANSVIEGLHPGSHAAVDYYLAAVADDPGYVPAWFRLARHSDGELRERALKRLLVVDADNAMPNYMTAADLLKRGDVTAALHQVTLGNKKPCRTYGLIVPTQFSLRFPAITFYESQGVSGKELSPSGLRFMHAMAVSRVDWDDSLTDDLRLIYRTLTEEGARLRTERQFRLAAEHLEAVIEMGFRLFLVEPHDSMVMLRGLFCVAREQREGLEAIYELTEESDRLAALHLGHECRKRFREGFRRYLDAGREIRKRDNYVSAVMLGIVNPQAEEQRMLRDVIRQAEVSEWTGFTR